MPYLQTNDTQLFYQDWGTGRPVVFVHGWAFGGGWDFQMLPLAEQGLRCIAYDQRGCGRSDDPGRGYDYDTLADDLAALIAHLDLHDTALVGHSMGSGVIARYLTRHGAGRISHAVLAATTMPFLLRTPDNPAGLEKTLLDATLLLHAQDRPRYVTELAIPFFGMGQPGCTVSPEMVQWGIHQSLHASARASAEMMRTSTLSDQRDEMKNFTMPTLVIHGDADLNTPLELTGRRTAAMIPGARLLVYAGAPHGLILTHADRFNADLRDFILA